MASFQDSSGGPFQASSLAKWFHSAPHKDLQLEDTTTIFSPADTTYREVDRLLIFNINKLIIAFRMSNNYKEI